MILFLETLPARNRAIAAWLIVAAVVIALALPVVLLGTTIAGQRQDIARIHADAAQYTGRIDTQREALAARQAAGGYLAIDHLAAQDGEAAAEQFRVVTAQITEALETAGVQMQEAPELRTTRLDDAFVRLSYRLYFIGDVEAAMGALAAPEHAWLQLATFDFISLSGNQQGRVRGEVEFTLIVPMEAEDA